MIIKSLKIQVLVLLVILIGCNPTQKSDNFEIKGNWSVLDDSTYYEYFFSEDTFEIFSLEWDFYPPKTYSVNNDSLIVQFLYGDSSISKYRIDIIDSTNFKLKYSNKEIVLKKIPNNQFTIEKLLAENYFYLGVDNPKNDYLRAKFIDSSFRIREANFLIDNNILNKDSLLKFWNELVDDSAMYSSYFEYLIDTIK